MEVWRSHKRSDHADVQRQDKNRCHLPGTRGFGRVVLFPRPNPDQRQDARPDRRTEKSQMVVDLQVPDNMTAADVRNVTVQADPLAAIR